MLEQEVKSLREEIAALRSVVEAARRDFEWYRDPAGHVVEGQPEEEPIPFDDDNTQPEEPDIEPDAEPEQPEQDEPAEPEEVPTVESLQARCLELTRKDRQTYKPQIMSALSELGAKMLKDLEGNQLVEFSKKLATIEGGE